LIATGGLLQNRPILIAILLFCSYESTASWLTIARHHRFPHDPVSIFGLAFSIFITASITYKSRFLGDRVVFGSATGAFALIAITAAPLSPPAMFAVETGKSFMWTVAAVVSLTVLVRGFKTSRSK